MGEIEKLEGMLSPYRVLDLTDEKGLLCGKLLGDLGADVIKLNIAKCDKKTLSQCPEPYNTLKITEEEAMRKIIQSAGKALVIISGGGKIDDTLLLQKTRTCMKAGASGIIYGRNIWQRKFKNAIKISKELQNLLKEF